MNTCSHMCCFPPMIIGVSRPERSGRDSVYISCDSKYIRNHNEIDVYFTMADTKLHLLNDFTIF